MKNAAATTATDFIEKGEKFEVEAGGNEQSLGEEDLVTICAL